MPRAVSLTEELVTTFGAGFGEITLVPSKGGVHEITINGELVHSKKATGKHPDPAAIVEEVRKRL